jgi:glutathione S-transferase
MMPNVPVLFTFRRCPYAIRARMAIAMSGQAVLQHEVDLKNKPEHMLAISPKATVPVLALPDGRVIDESLDIMLWAFRQHDPDNMLGADGELPNEARHLITRNDFEFKSTLDRYKYAEAYPMLTRLHYREQGEIFLHDLNEALQKHAYLLGEKPGLADLAIMPFIRQFAKVDADWFEANQYKALRAWAQAWESSDLFKTIMKKCTEE